MKSILLVVLSLGYAVAEQDHSLIQVQQIKLGSDDASLVEDDQQADASIEDDEDGFIEADPTFDADIEDDEDGLIEADPTFDDDDDWLSGVDHNSTAIEEAKKDMEQANADAVQASTGGKGGPELEMVQVNVSGGEYFRLKVRTNDKCMDMSHVGNNLYMHGCHDGLNQLFYWHGRYIKTPYNDLCMDSNLNNGNVYMRRCHSGSNQQWYFTGDQLRNLHSRNSKCLDMNLHAHNNLYMHGCNGQSQQKFRTLAKDPKVIALTACFYSVGSYSGGSRGWHYKSVTTQQGSSWSKSTNTQTQHSVSSHVEAKAHGAWWSASGSVDAAYSLAIQSASSQSGTSFRSETDSWWIDMSRPCYLYQGTVRIQMSDGSRIVNKGVVLQSDKKLTVKCQAY